jgi:hypothetical protein
MDQGDVQPGVGQGGPVLPFERRGRLPERLQSAHRVAEVPVDDPGVDLQGGAAPRVERVAFGQDLAVEVERLAEGAQPLQHDALVDAGDADLLGRPGLAPVPAGQPGGLGVPAHRLVVAAGGGGDQPQVGEVDHLALAVAGPAVDLQRLPEVPLGVVEPSEVLEHEPGVVERPRQARRVVQPLLEAQGLSAFGERRAVVAELGERDAGVAARQGGVLRAGRARHGAVGGDRLPELPLVVEREGVVEGLGGEGGGEEGEEREVPEPGHPVILR